MDAASKSSLSTAYGLAVAARAANQSTVRIEIEPRRNFLQRYVRLWDSAIGKVVGRTAMPAAGSVEGGVTDVFEAWRAAQIRDATRFEALPNLSVNAPAKPQRMSTNR